MCEREREGARDREVQERFNCLNFVFGSRTTSHDCLGQGPPSLITEEPPSTPPLVHLAV